MGFEVKLNKVDNKKFGDMVELQFFIDGKIREDHSIIMDEVHDPTPPFKPEYNTYINLLTTIMEHITCTELALRPRQCVGILIALNELEIFEHDNLTFFNVYRADEDEDDVRMVLISCLARLMYCKNPFKL